MKKLLRLLIVSLAVLLLLAIGGAFFLDGLVVQAVEKGGSHVLGVETGLEEADIGLISGKTALGGLAISNPAGFSEPYFFTLASARLEMPPTALLRDRITIPLLALEGVHLRLVRNASGTNYGKILDNLQRFSGTGPKEEPSPESEPGKAFVLQRLVIRDIRADVELLPAGGELTKLSLTVPEITVDDLSNEMTTAELVSLVVRTVIRATLAAGGSTLPADLLEDLRTRLDGIEAAASARFSGELDELEERLGEKARELGPEAEEAVKKASEKVDETLDGFLKKNKKD